MGIEYDIFISGLFAKADKNGTPLSGAFELTSRCPLDCKMCYIHRKENDCEAIKQEKTAEWWLRLAEEAKNAGMFMLLLTGGEPLLRKDFEEIYLGCQKMGLLVSVNTNGLLINDEKIKFFAENPPQRLNITLYGASAETYKNLCGNGEAFEKVLSAIIKLKQTGVKLKLNFTVTQYNVHDTEKVYELAKQLEIPIQPVSYMFPPVRIGEKADRLTPEEAAQAQFDCQFLSMGEEKLLRHIQNKATAVRVGEIGECSDANGERIPCRAAKSTFWITWDGKMTPCGMMNKPMTEISDFNEAWESIKKARESIILPLKCKTCELRNYCDMCAAVTLAETGEFSGIPEYICKKAAQYKKLCDKAIMSKK